MPQPNSCTAASSSLPRPRSTGPGPGRPQADGCLRKHHRFLPYCFYHSAEGRGLVRTEATHVAATIPTSQYGTAPAPRGAGGEDRQPRCRLLRKAARPASPPHNRGASPSLPGPRSHLRWSKEWMLRAAFPCPPPTQLRERPNMAAAAPRAP